MTREEQIYSAAINDCDLYGESDHFQFTRGAKWADEHPNIEIIKHIFDYAIKHTNILLVENASKVEWEKLAKQAMGGVKYETSN